MIKELQQNNSLGKFKLNILCINATRVHYFITLLREWMRIPLHEISHWTQIEIYCITFDGCAVIFVILPFPHNVDLVVS